MGNKYSSFYRADLEEMIRKAALETISAIADVWDGVDADGKVKAIQGVLTMLAALDEEITKEDRDGAE